MFHGDELAAFRAYAAALPGNCTFLVDTYDTLTGVAHAIEVGRELRARGHELGGIRLDSGDLAHLSIEARRMLDAAGFPGARIVGRSMAGFVGVELVFRGHAQKLNGLNPGIFSRQGVRFRASGVLKILRQKAVQKRQR